MTAAPASAGQSTNGNPAHTSARRGASRKITAAATATVAARVRAANRKKRSGSAEKSPFPGSGLPSHSSHSWPSRRSVSMRMSWAREGAASTVMRVKHGSGAPPVSSANVRGAPYAVAFGNNRAPRTAHALGTEAPPAHRSPHPRRLLRRRGDLSDRARRGRRPARRRGAATAGALGGRQRHAPRAARSRERDGGRERGTRRRGGPESGIPLDRPRLVATHGLGRCLRHLGGRDGGGASIRPAAPARPLLRRVRDVGRDGGYQRRRPALGAVRQRASVGGGD